MPLFHPQIIRISTKKVGFGQTQNVHFCCFLGRRSGLYLWWSRGKSLWLAHFHFSKALWYSPSSTIALSSNPLVLRQPYKAACGRQKTVQLPPSLCRQNRIISDGRKTTWTQTAQLIQCIPDDLRPTSIMQHWLFTRQRQETSNPELLKKARGPPLLPAPRLAPQRSPSIVWCWIHPARPAFHRLLNPLLLKHEISLGSIKKKMC